MTKRIAATGAIIAMLTLTAACGTDRDSTRESDLTPQVVTVNGREVTCVGYPSGFVGGLSCDWEGSR